MEHYKNGSSVSSCKYFLIMVQHLPEVKSHSQGLRFFCVFFSRASMGSELTSDNSKLHGHTNEHVQFEGAHQEINMSLLPCRHTDNDKCIGILGMHPCFY